MWHVSPITLRNPNFNPPSPTYINNNNNNNKSFSYSILTKDKLFLTFLTCQVKGVFNNTDLFCNHYNQEKNKKQNNLQNNKCIYCLRTFIKHSEFKEYFKKLYNWFKHSNFDIDKNTEIYFETIHCYLNPKEISYFCSEWLDDIYMTNEIQWPILSIFEKLCFKGHFETLQWYYKCEEQNLLVTNNRIKQYNFFILACQRENNINKNEILDWLLSLKIFENFDIHLYNDSIFHLTFENRNIEVVKYLLNLKGEYRISKKNIEEAFRFSCVYPFTEAVELLLKLEGDRYINVHDDNEWAFRNACKEGHFNVVTLLLDLKGNRMIDVHAENDDAFISACKYDPRYSGNKEVIRLLLELKGDRIINLYNIENERAFREFCQHDDEYMNKLLLKLSEEKRIPVLLL